MLSKRLHPIVLRAAMYMKVVSSVIWCLCRAQKTKEQTARIRRAGLPGETCRRAQAIGALVEQNERLEVTPRPDSFSTLESGVGGALLLFFFLLMTSQGNPDTSLGNPDTGHPDVVHQLHSLTPAMSRS